MRVEFANAKLQKVCESEKELQRAYGKKCAKKVMTRLADLRAAPALADLRNMPGRCHELVGNRGGQLGIALTSGRRLVLEPSEGWPDAKQEGTDVWTEVDAVCVLEIVDYHDG